ncbi:hypothetical protein DDZ13_10130 [Coraliomargarita sinensis]|uniref:Uncharacterized protein n=1 Tax=Coraliomargarita sinensis TaxID=2174842 RepID=A0A317ZEA5_9BACT|nr:hypothetical protein DDZ13_10130 [Coraliomargarita sinensis]
MPGRFALLQNRTANFSTFMVTSDTVVPLEENSGGIQERYKALGGPMQLRVIPLLKILDPMAHRTATGEKSALAALVDYVFGHAR